MNTNNTKYFLLTFWYRPARTMRQLLDSKQGHVYALACAALFSVIQLERFSFTEPKELVRYTALFALSGVACLFLFGWLMRNFGRWFKVEAEQREIRTALGLGILPWIILFGALYLLLRSGLSPETIAAGYFPVVIFVFIYGFYILLFSLTAALRLSVIKTFLCLVVTLVFSLFPLTVLAQFMARYLS